MGNTNGWDFLILALLTSPFWAPYVALILGVIISPFMKDKGDSD